jgi:glycerol kinase
MTRGTSGFPTEDTVRSFQEAQSLLDNFEKVKRRSRQKDLKVTDVFLLLILTHKSTSTT